MKCPVCNHKLEIAGHLRGEWVCENENCEAVKKRRSEKFTTYPEFYGITQKEVNKTIYVRRCKVKNESR